MFALKISHNAFFTVFDGPTGCLGGFILGAALLGLQCWFVANTLIVVLCSQNVISMRLAFSQTSFNGDISSWDVSKVANFRSMFAAEEVSNSGDDPLSPVPFNGNIGTWNTSSATVMRSMFFGCEFNRDISGWDVSNVKNFKGMFSTQDVGSFVHPFSKDLNEWDTSSALTMEEMFSISSFNGDISGWDVSKVTDFSSMFRGETPNPHPFNGDLSVWNTSSANVMASMFENCLFNGDIGDWDVAQVTNFAGMFQRSNFNGAIGEWDVSQGVNFGSMFFEASFNQDINLWTPLSAEDMGFMFTAFSGESNPFNQDLCPWGEHLPATVSIDFMFSGSSCLTTADPNLAASPVTPLCHPCGGCFPDESALEDAVAANWNDPLADPFLTYGPIEDWCFDPLLTDFSGLFEDNELISNEDLSGWVCRFTHMASNLSIIHCLTVFFSLCLMAQQDVSVGSCLLWDTVLHHHS